MEEALLTTALRIADRRSAAMFRRQAICRLLVAVAQPATAAQVAKAVAMPLNLACYHLRSLCALGLAEIVGTRPRPGRAAKLYRAAASAFFVPAEFAERSWGEELSRELRQLLERSQREMAGELFVIGDGCMQVRKIDSAHKRTPSTEMWLPLRLDDRTARELIDELHMLARRYKPRAGAGGRDFLLHIAMAARG